MLKPLLINMMIVVMPILIWQSIRVASFADRSSLRRFRWFGGFLLALASMACMEFPLVEGDGFLWDLRFVPLSLSVLYGGLEAGIITLVMLLGYRYHLSGGYGFMESAGNGFLLFVVLLLIRSFFIRSSKKRKLVLAASLGMGLFIQRIAFAWYVYGRVGKPAFLPDVPIWGYVAFLLGCALALSLSILMVENGRCSLRLQEQYRNLVVHAHDAIGLLDESRWLYINPAGIEMFGAKSAAELMERPLSKFVPASEQECFMQQWERVLQEELPLINEEKEWIRMDGRIIQTEFRALPTHYGNKRVVQVIIRDISHKKSSEEMMLRSEKLSMAGQLAAGIAHEIRNPLTALKGFLQLMRHGSIQERYLQIMMAELERIELIVGELLLLAKPQTTRMMKSDVESLFQQVIPLVETQAIINSVDIVVVRDSDGPIGIHCDINQIKQVFLNLLKNAVEAMQDGGMLRIVMGLRDGHAVIRIQDQGCGIPEEMIERIGQPFYTTKEKGTGLGMMVTYKII